jgi:hypothetical protein
MKQKRFSFNDLPLSFLVGVDARDKRGHDGEVGGVSSSAKSGLARGL